MVPRLAVRFSAQYPEVALDVHMADTDVTIASLLAREVEVAVVGCMVEHPKLVGHVIEEEELVPVIATADEISEDSVTAEDLAEMLFVMREEGSATRRAVEEGLREVGIGPLVAMELGSNMAVAGAVAEGAGIGVIPSRFVASQSSVRPLKVRGLSIRRPFVLVVERGRKLSPAAEAFVQICMERN